MAVRGLAVTRRQRSLSRSQRYARAAGLSGACLVAVWVVSCQGQISPPGPVLLIGDSIFHGAADELESELRSDGWDTRMEAHPGAGIRGGGFSGVDWPRRLPELVSAVDPQVVIVELGTNGCGPCDSVPRAIDDVMVSLAGVDVVLWLTVQTDSPRSGEATAVNATLEEAADKWANLELLRYDQWVAGRPELVPPDGVHPTPDGEVALAGQVADALEDRAEPAVGRGSGAAAVVGLLVGIAYLSSSKRRQRRVTYGRRRGRRAVDASDRRPDHDLPATVE